ncbi:hypothetical protein HELRODRAFT_180883 [Helobdella robusta]|uniref:Uncharacterized protein n=1 Tax=Helobdella robusta TaxID=6412 RepID=T1FGD2_HELRO|nr:hypothetical protein HELRODRAFT_180883 [Helobdella robusta]ESN93564.1 hypothetical protein HELRODRAFT_180883 [Helobdella robusta]
MVDKVKRTTNKSAKEGSNLTLQCFHCDSLFPLPTGVSDESYEFIITANNLKFFCDACLKKFSVEKQFYKKLEQSKSEMSYEEKQFHKELEKGNSEIIEEMKKLNDVL